jgi:hypothetical protein
MWRAERSMTRAVARARNVTLRQCSRAALGEARSPSGAPPHPDERETGDFPMRSPESSDIRRQMTVPEPEHHAERNLTPWVRGSSPKPSSVETRACRRSCSSSAAGKGSSVVARAITVTGVSSTNRSNSFVIPMNRKLKHFQVHRQRSLRRRVKRTGQGAIRSRWACTALTLKGRARGDYDFLRA